MYRAGVRGFEFQILDGAIEGQVDIGGVAEPVVMFQRMGDLKLDLFCLQGTRRPRHRNLLDIPGVDADHLMRAQCGDHLRGRQRAGGAQIRGAVDRDLRRRAGIVDDVADPHQITRNRNVGAQHGGCDRVVAVFRKCRGGGRREQGGCEEQAA